MLKRQRSLNPAYVFLAPQLRVTARHEAGRCAGVNTSTHTGCVYGATKESRLNLSGKLSVTLAPLPLKKLIRYSNLNMFTHGIGGTDQSL